MKFPEVVGCLHLTHAKSLDLCVSTVVPLNGGTIQTRICRIELVLFESEYTRVCLSITSESPSFMKAPGGEEWFSRDLDPDAHGRRPHAPACARLTAVGGRVR